MTWIEAAINGPWGPDRQAGVPVTVEECIEEGVACVEAGAAIVHVHALDPATGEQDDDPETYAAVIEGIRERTEAVVYPTIPMADLAAARGVDPAERYAHQAALADRGLLEWAVVDPGSVNLSRFDEVARDEPGFVYANPESHVRAGLAVAARTGTTPSYAIYEPGFLRLGAALADRYPGVGQPVYRFMFSTDYAFGYPPEPYALESYLDLLAAEAGDRDGGTPPWMVAGLGVDVTPLIETAVERGGGVRVGLEDAPLGTERSNVEWVRRAREAVEAAGGRVATAGEVRSQLSDGG